MAVSTDYGNANLDDYARQFNVLEANPSRTPPSGASLELQFKAKLLDLDPDVSPNAAPSSSPSQGIPLSQIVRANLANPDVEPQFNVPGVDGTMGTPSGVSLFPNGDPSPQDINQHSLGDCFFLGALGSMAANTPDFVKNMVQANPDGTYTVHMFDPAGKPVDVTVDNKVPLDSNGNLVDNGSADNQANWASIVTKAFVKYNDVYHVNGVPGATGYAAVNDGGPFNNNYYYALTGVTVTTTPNSSSTTPAQQDALAQKMHDAINNGQTVYATVYPGQTLPDGAEIVGDHQYSVIDVNKDANGNWYVDVRNPWGSTPTADTGVTDEGDGVVRMSMSEYIKDTTLTNIGDKSIGSPPANIWQPPGGPLGPAVTQIHGIPVGSLAPPKSIGSPPADNSPPADSPPPPMIHGVPLGSLPAKS